jgi:membrane-associated phospholipid phosphatase
MTVTLRMGRQQWTALAAAGSAVAIVRTHERLGLPRALTTACAFATPPIIAAGFNRSRARDTAIWAAQMWAYKNSFELPDEADERLRRRTHFDYPIAVDSLIGAGMPLGQRLQRRLRRRGQLSALDKALSFFYWTWEAEPHVAMAWIRWKRPNSFAAAAGRLAATFDLTLVGYWLIPTAPPWWVSEKTGRLGGDVRRVMAEVASWLKGERNPTEGEHELGANPFAAMPSDHFASAATTAMLLAEQDPRLGALGWCYALLLAFALVYLGEHYVADVLAGLALAIAVDHAGRPLAQAGEAVLSLGA